MWGCLRPPLPKCQVQATSLEVGGLTSLAAVSLAPTNNEVTKYCFKKKLSLQLCLQGSTKEIPGYYYSENAEITLRCSHYRKDTFTRSISAFLLQDTSLAKDLKASDVRCELRECCCSQSSGCEGQKFSSQRPLNVGSGFSHIP